MICADVRFAAPKRLFADHVHDFEKYRRLPWNRRYQAGDRPMRGRAWICDDYEQRLGNRWLSQYDEGGDCQASFAVTSTTILR
jgi:hypothetical protein